MFNKKGMLLLSVLITMIALAANSHAYPLNYDPNNITIMTTTVHNTTYQVDDVIPIEITFELSNTSYGLEYPVEADDISGSLRWSGSESIQNIQKKVITDGASGSEYNYNDNSFQVSGMLKLKNPGTYNLSASTKMNFDVPNVTKTKNITFTINVVENNKSFWFMNDAYELSFGGFQFDIFANHSDSSPNVTQCSVYDSGTRGFYLTGEIANTRKPNLGYNYSKIKAFELMSNYDGYILRDNNTLDRVKWVPYDSDLGSEDSLKWVYQNESYDLNSTLDNIYGISQPNQNGDWYVLGMHTNGTNQVPAYALLNDSFGMEHREVMTGGGVSYYNITLRDLDIGPDGRHFYVWKNDWIVRFPNETLNVENVDMTTGTNELYGDVVNNSDVDYAVHDLEIKNVQYIEDSRKGDAVYAMFTDIGNYSVNQGDGGSIRLDNPDNIAEDPRPRDIRMFYSPVLAGSFLKSDTTINYSAVSYDFSTGASTTVRTWQYDLSTDIVTNQNISDGNNTITVDESSFYSNTGDFDARDYNARDYNAQCTLSDSTTVTDDMQIHQYDVKGETKISKYYIDKYGHMWLGEFNMEPQEEVYVEVRPDGDDYTVGTDAFKLGFDEFAGGYDSAWDVLFSQKLYSQTTTPVVENFWNNDYLTISGFYNNTYIQGYPFSRDAYREAVLDVRYRSPHMNDSRGGIAYGFGDLAYMETSSFVSFGTTPFAPTPQLIFLNESVKKEISVPVSPVNQYNNTFVSSQLRWGDDVSLYMNDNLVAEYSENYFSQGPEYNENHPFFLMRNNTGFINSTLDYVRSYYQSKYVDVGSQNCKIVGGEQRCYVKVTSNHTDDVLIEDLSYDIGDVSFTNKQELEVTVLDKEPLGEAKIESKAPDNLSLTYEPGDVFEFNMSISGSDEDADYYRTRVYDGFLNYSVVKDYNDTYASYPDTVPAIGSPYVLNTSNYTGTFEVVFGVKMFNTTDGTFKPNSTRYVIWTLSEDVENAPDIDSTYPVSNISLTEGDTQVFNVSWSDVDSSTFDVDWIVDGTVVQSADGTSSQVSSYTFDSTGYSGEVELIVNITGVDDGLSNSTAWNIDVQSDGEEDDETTGGGGGGSYTPPEDDEEEDDTTTEISTREQDNLFSVITGATTENATMLQMDRLNRTINILPGREKQYSERLYNTGDEDIEVTISVIDKGQSDWVELAEDSVTVEAYGESEFMYNLTVPENTSVESYNVFMRVSGPQESSVYKVDVNVLPQQLSWAWVVGAGLVVAIVAFYTARRFVTK